MSMAKDMRIDMPLTIRPRRSALYIPGSNVRALEKARGLATDMIILDLEDAVAPDAKLLARQNIATALATGGYGPGYGQRDILIRINALDTPWGHDDLACAVQSGAHGIVAPKVTCAEDIQGLHTALDAAGAQPDFMLWAMIETPAAILTLPQIAACGTTTCLSGFILGLNDLAKEMHAQMDSGRTAFLPAITQAVMAARAYGLFILDSVYNNFQDAEGLERECAQGRLLGCDGKSLIHPAQIDTANRIFAPTPAQIEEARAIVAAFNQPENAGKGAINLNGNMVELLHRKAAVQLLALQAYIDGVAGVRGT